MVESKLVELVVAGSNPVDHPIFAGGENAALQHNADGPTSFLIFDLRLSHCDEMTFRPTGGGRRGVALTSPEFTLSPLAFTAVTT